MINKLPRCDVTKRIWLYIKQYNLQNPNNKREILCDEKLEKLFKRKKIDMFQMTKVLSTVNLYIYTVYILTIIKMI